MRHLKRFILTMLFITIFVFNSCLPSYAVVGEAVAVSVASDLINAYSAAVLKNELEGNSESGQDVVSTVSADFDTWLSVNRVDDYNKLHNMLMNPYTVFEGISVAADIGQRGFVVPSDFVRVAVPALRAYLDDIGVVNVVLDGISYFTLNSGGYTYPENLPDYDSAVLNGADLDSRFSSLLSKYYNKTVSPIRNLSYWVNYASPSAPYVTIASYDSSIIAIFHKDAFMGTSFAYAYKYLSDGSYVRQSLRNQYDHVYANYKYDVSAPSVAANPSYEIDGTRSFWADTAQYISDQLTDKSRSVVIQGTDASEEDADVVAVNVPGRVVNDEDGKPIFVPLSVPEIFSVAPDWSTDDSLSRVTDNSIVVDRPEVGESAKTTAAVSVTGFRAFAATVTSWLTGFFDKLISALRAVFMPDTAAIRFSITDAQIKLQNTFGIQMFDFGEIWGPGSSGSPPDVKVPVTICGETHELVVLSFQHLNQALLVFRRLIRALLMLWTVLFNINQFFCLIGAGSLSLGLGDVGDEPKSVDWKAVLRSRGV